MEKYSKSSNHLSSRQWKGSNISIGEHVRKYWMRACLLGIFTFIISRKDVSIDISMSAMPFGESFLSTNEVTTVVNSNHEDARPMNTSMLAAAKASSKQQKPKKITKNDNIANTYSNMVYTEKGIKTEELSAARAEKRKKQLAYVERFAEVAQKEMKRYGIPASITLAQGLLESNVGESKLARKNKNHFGIKCFSKSCKKGHCTNFTDDSHKDFFRKYTSTWDSYRAHSLLLKNNKRYAKLFKLDKHDYKQWAIGLKKAGYATDKQYAEKIINLIKDLKLYKFDH